MLSILLCLILSSLYLSSVAEAFVAPACRIKWPSTTVNPDAPSQSRGRVAARSSSLRMSSVEAPLPSLNNNAEGEDDDDGDMEWVAEEFELLTERDFYNTEWKIGTLMDNMPREAQSIDTTWVRLVTTDAGENKAIWGDGAAGKWTVDTPSQFFSISKESFGGWLGKRIWAGTVDDFYFLDGTVRGWSPLTPASVVGQWQAKRLGPVDGEDRCTDQERGTAPWFLSEEERAARGLLPLEKEEEGGQADDGLEGLQA